MKRLITAPCLGIVVGALELGTLFAVLTMLESCQGCFLGGGDEWVYFIGTFGMIAGGVFGGIIGLVVALRDAHGRSGLMLGGAIGLGFTILVAIRTVSLGDLLLDPLGNPWSTVACSLLPFGASIGFLSAVATDPSKEPRPADAELSRSHRIFD